MAGDIFFSCNPICNSISSKYRIASSTSSSSHSGFLGVVVKFIHTPWSFTGEEEAMLDLYGVLDSADIEATMPFCCSDPIAGVRRPVDLRKLDALGGRFVKVLAMLVALSFLIIEDADDLTKCSPLGRAVIPGNGRTLRVHTSDKRASSRALSPRDGARTGMRLLVVDSDCDRLMVILDVVESTVLFTSLVLLRMTWHRGDFDPTVVAR